MSRTIMIVDDDTLITSTLSTLIEMTLDYNVIMYNNPVDALNSDMLAAGEIDMIISDFLMPEMNGLDFLKNALELDPSIIAIILTGYADKQNAIRCINELGIYYYLEKPWDNDVLIKIIENGFEKKHLENELEKRLDELEESYKEISGLYGLLKNEYNKETTKVEALNQWNHGLELAVKQSTSALRNLLDNAEEGFLSFGYDLLIDKEFSYECVNIFNSDIYNKSFTELIFPDNKEQQSFLEALLPKLLDETDAGKQEILISLIPDELQINGKYIRLKYKLIERQKEGSSGQSSKAVMVVLTDITEKRQLEFKMHEEQNILRLIVKAITNRADFLECITSYRDFCSNKINEILFCGNTLEQILYELFRNIHNFKGTFGQLDFIYIIDELHKCESALSDFIAAGDSMTLNQLKDFMLYTDMEKWLEKDVEILQNYLGSDFFTQKDILLVDKAKIISLEKKLISKLPPSDYNQFLPDLRKLRYVPFKELLKTYPSYIERLSGKMEKPMKQLIIEGGSTLVDPDKYIDFTKSLVHVFRNIMDHGIEDPEYRESIGKDYSGRIRCRIDNKDKLLIINISDDGKGLNLGEIARKAAKKGIIAAEDINKLSENEIINLILKDGFSTRDDVSELSGRGVGLSAVNKEVERLGGTVTINTNLGTGTEFSFRLPMQEAASMEDMPIVSIMNPLINSLTRYVFDLTGIRLRSFNNFGLQQPERLSLMNTTAIINVKGALRGKFVVTLDENLIKKVVNSFVIESIGDDEASLYYEDVLAESLNTILGNSIKLFPGLENLVAISAPVTMSAERALLRCPDSNTWTCNMESNSGNLSLSFIAAEGSNII